MNGSCRKICRNYRRCIGLIRRTRRAEEGDHKGLAQETLRFPWADCRYFNKYCPVLTSSHFPVNRDHTIQQRLDERCKENIWTLPALVGSAINGFARKASQLNGNLASIWLRNTGNTLSNFLNLYKSPSDFKEMQGLKKLNEAQEVLQKRLTKAREESKTAADKAEKQALEIMIKSTEESIDRLLKLKKKVKAVLEKKRS